MTARTPREDLRQHVKLAVGSWMSRAAVEERTDHLYNAIAADVLAVRDDALTTAQRERDTAQERITAVLAECDRIEAAVHANPQDPTFDGAYLAPLRHIRTALAPHTGQDGDAT